MSGDPPRAPYLEPTDACPSEVASPDVAETPTPANEPAWLEPTVDTGTHETARRKTVRAEDRRITDDGVSLALVTALGSDRPLLCALWPEVSPADLLRTPPTPEAFTARCDFAMRALDAVARRDAASRARAEVAQRALEQALTALRAKGGEPCAAARAELACTQTDELMEAVRVLAGEGRVLYASDSARLDAAAEARGIDPTIAGAIVRARGYEVHATEAREWAPCEALPGAPTTMDALAAALLQYPVQGAEAVRSGVVLAWLRANGAASDVIERARGARLTAERQGAGGESLAVHLQAWALGRRVLTLGPWALRSPGEIMAAVHAGRISPGDLALSARSGVLAAWLRVHGWMQAAAAADLVAGGDPTGTKRLAWSLGEPLVLADCEFTDAATLARAVCASEGLRESIVGVYASGELLAWLESLPGVQRDDGWIARMRAARGTPSGLSGDQFPLWQGIYGNARVGSLTLVGDDGQAVMLTSLDPLRVTAQVSGLWDALKHAYATGELLAWLAVVAPDVNLPERPRPPRDLDAELNALLWDLGHTGMVMEWGARDFPVSTPTDLVRAYQASWQGFEGQLACGYVWTWLTRFYGGQFVGGVALGEVVDGLRGEVGRLPSGYLALKVALVCGLRYLPLDPCEPGDQANFRGYVSTDSGTAGDGNAWAPLGGHLRYGTALVWLALQASVRPQLAESMVRSSLEPWKTTQDDLPRVTKAVARALGVPRPSAVLQSELDAATGRAGTVKGVRLDGGWRGTAITLAMVLTVLGLAWGYHLGHADDLDVRGPTPTDGTEALVRMAVTVHGVPGMYPRGLRHRDDRILRVAIETRDSPVHLGPCPPGTPCDGIFEGVRLSPGVPFELVVTEDQTLWRTRLGATWLRWHGTPHEELHATLGTVQVDVILTRMFSPGAPTRRVDAPAMVLPPGADGAGGVAGVVPRRTFHLRAHAPRRSPAPPIPPAVPPK